MSIDKYLFDHKRLVSVYLIFCIANLLPVVGIVYFDWTSVELGTFYWVEIGLVLVFSLVKSLFSKKVFEFQFRGQLTIRFEGYTNKRGGIRLTDGFPPLYPRNLPNLLPYLMLGLGWGMIGLLIVIESQFSILENAYTLQIGTVGPLLVFATIVSYRHLVEVRDVFFGKNQYEECSAGMLNRQAIEYFVIIGFLVFLSRAEVADPEALAWGLFGLKVGYELLRYRPEQLHWGDNIVQEGLGLSPTYSDPDWISGPCGVPLDEVHTNQRSTIVSALLFAAVSDLLIPYWIFIFFATVLALGGGANVVIPFIVLITVSIGVTFYPLKVGEYLLSYRWMSYRLYEDELVGYDRVLKRAQWRIDLDKIRSISVEERYVDSKYDTQTIVIETNKESIILAHLPSRSQLHNSIRDARDQKTA